MRLWNSTHDDDGTMHAMGNGELVVFGQGPNVVSFYGPPYTSPKICTIDVVVEGELQDQLEREPGSAVWEHTAMLNGAPCMTFVDYAATGSPVWMRQMRCEQAGVRFHVHPHADGGFAPCTSIDGAFRQILKPGTICTHLYTTSLWCCHWLLAEGCCALSSDGDGGVYVDCTPGEGYFAIVGGSSIPAGLVEAETFRSMDKALLLENTRQAWFDFTARRYAARPELEMVPDEVAAVLDATAVMLQCQRGRQGGMIPGWVLPYAYLRDQYGASRGLLALGMFEEARENLMFRFRKFNLHGNLKTGEGIGLDSLRHIHENDDVEGPAYTILQVRDYVQSTGDAQLGRTLWPMLDWCWTVQLKHLVDGMLPFNGDETYVAGAFFPRSGLLQGSADTTLAFIAAGQWLLPFAEEHALWTTEQANEYRIPLNEAIAGYRNHFLDGDRIWANAPEREALIQRPRFRHGVCEAHCQNFGWVELTNNNRYLCYECRATKDLPEERPGRTEVNSVGLLPSFLGANVLSTAELFAVTERILNQAAPNGHIPSVPNIKGCVGYDPGLLLIALTKLEHTAAAEQNTRVLRMADQAGTWNEYYDPTDVSRVRCIRTNAWASGINCDALVRYFASQQAFE